MTQIIVKTNESNKNKGLKNNFIIKDIPLLTEDQKKKEINQLVLESSVRLNKIQHFKQTPANTSL